VTLVFTCNRRSVFDKFFPWVDFIIYCLFCEVGVAFKAIMITVYFTTICSFAIAKPRISQSFSFLLLLSFSEIIDNILTLSDTTFTLQIKMHFKDIGVPADVKYIDPTYMVRACRANASDAILCTVLGQNAVSCLLPCTAACLSTCKLALSSSL